jgi:hypothetical protein
MSGRDLETDPQTQMETSSSSSPYTTEWVENHQKKNRRQSRTIAPKQAEAKLNKDLVVKSGEPSKSDYLVPMDVNERVEMVN